MGTILIEAMIESGAASAPDLFITNRTIQKALDIKKTTPEVTVFRHSSEILEFCDCIFLALKPHDIFPFIQEHKELFRKNHLVVSITSPVSTEQLGYFIPSQCARLIPSITNRALSGVSLLSFDERCTDLMKDWLSYLASQFSRPMEIEESITRVSSDIVSCGPAFFTYITRRFIQSATEETGITHEEAEQLASDMLIGLGELLKKEIYTLPTLQEKVCVKGGVTGEGIRVMDEELGKVFNHVFLATQARFVEDKEVIDKQITKFLP